MCCTEFHYGLGGISRDAKTDLQFFDYGSVNALMRTDNFLLNFIVPYMVFVDAGFLFLQDNTCPHVVH